MSERKTIPPPPPVATSDRNAAYERVLLNLTNISTSARAIADQADGMAEQVRDLGRNVELVAEHDTTPGAL